LGFLRADSWSRRRPVEGWEGDQALARGRGFNKKERKYTKTTAALREQKQAGSQREGVKKGVEPLHGEKGKNLSLKTLYLLT